MTDSKGKVDVLVDSLPNVKDRPADINETEPGIHD